MNEAQSWHSLDLSEVEQSLDTSRSRGLSEAEANVRLSRRGPNELPEKKKRPPIILLLSQFNDFMIWVLLAAVFVSGVVLRETLDAAVIAVVVVLNAILGFAQEFKAERAIAALKRLAAPQANVIRDGAEREIPARELVAGDLLILEAGDRVPADARLIEESNLTVDEAILTGESVASDKDAVKTALADTPLLDRENMLYMGTTALTGHARALVIATGAASEMGRIAELVQETDKKETPLQQELRSVGKRIAIACLVIAAVVIGVGVARGNAWSLMFLAGVSLAVAAIPEGLPAIVTITLALGLERMAKENAIVRRLPAVETLGAATVICSDKTGTLTRNEMEVRLIRLDESVVEIQSGRPLPKDSRLDQLLTAGLLCNDARRGAGETYIGDPTEIALLIAGERAGLAKSDLSARFARVGEIPFDSDRKMMTTVHASDGGFIAYAKGAPEVIVERSTHILTERGIEELTPAKKQEVLAENADLAAKAYRTLAFATRQVADEREAREPSAETTERGLTLIGLAGLIDPPRPEVYDAISTCKKAKIEVVMVTGDHLATAEAIGRDLSLLSGDKVVITSTELTKMSDEELTERADQIGIYARIAAEDKMRIIEALRRKGHTIAMTGDGVNDAPALKNADIGVAMGKIGADVAKEASDMVLADDNFATIVAAIREGRVIFDNLKKFVYFLLSCNVSEVLVMFIGMMVGLPLPLLPVQILWINLVTDGLPALALGVDVAEPSVMERPPRRKTEHILATPKQLNLAWQGLLMTAGALGSYVVALYVLKTDLAEARTILFTTLVLVQLLHTVNSRSETTSAIKVGLFSNRYLVAAVAGAILLQLAVIYAPFLQPLFHTEAVTATNWAVIIGLSAVPVLAIEATKKLSASRAART